MGMACLCLCGLLLFGCTAAKPELTEPKAAQATEQPTEVPAEQPTEEPVEEPTTEPQQTQGSDTMSFTMEDYTIAYGEKTVFGRLYTPDGEGKYPAVILSHGFNGTNSDFVKECRYYAEHGYVAYALDFCGGSGRSRSSGKSTDMTLTSEKEDLLAVFEHIRSLDNVDSDHIVLFGGSQGGLISALAAAELGDKVACLPLYFPAFNIPSDWRANHPNLDAEPETFDFWGLKMGKGFIEDLYDIDVFETIGNYKGDVLIIHGTEDTIVAMTYARRAVDTYDNAELITMPGEGHGFSPAGGQTAMEYVLEFMDEHCK